MHIKKLPKTKISTGGTPWLMQRHPRVGVVSESRRSRVASSSSRRVINLDARGPLDTRDSDESIE